MKGAIKNKCEEMKMTWNQNYYSCVEIEKIFNIICIFSVCGLNEDQRKSVLAFQFSDGNIDTKIKKVGHTKMKC